MSTRTEEQSYEKLVADLKEIKNKNDRFLYACHNGDDITSLKLLQHLSNKDMEVGDMLNNEECRFLFKEFCQLELSTENIDFWEECAIYEKWTNKKQRLIHGNNLYNMYISRNALKSINIDMSAVRAVKSRLDSCHIKDNDDLSDLLTHVKLLVEHCMSDTFFRFCKHELYKEKVMSLTAIDFDRIVEKKRNCATLLHICAHLNKVKCIEFLLGKGMNINCLDKQKATALDYAVANNSDNAALYLMTNGAKINFKHNSVHFPSVDMPGNYSRIAGILFDEFVHRTECSLANRYNMVGRSRNLSITNLQNINNRVNRTISLDKIGENVPMGLKSTSLFVVEDKNTLKRCNAFCYSFNSAAYAIKYRNDNWKQFNLFEHENLIAIRDLILQKDLNEQYDLYIIKERYHDNLTEFIISKKENDQFLSEKMMTNYALQLLSVFEYLQSRNYVHAPGAITPDCIYFNQMYDEIVLDIGKSSSSMWYECLFQNSQSLLTHPFVPPECKKFFILNQKKSNIQDLYKCTEKTDVYSFGVIMLMMTTLISDHTALYQLLIEGNSSRFQENLRQKIISLPKTPGYSVKWIDFINKALEPDPNKRFSFKELISLLEGKNIQAFNVEPKFERDYTITKKISTSFLTELQKYDKEISTIGFFDLNALNNNEIVSLYLVEHKGTMKRCNAFCNTFLNEKDAYRFYERSLEIFNNLRHENLVSIRDIYFQKNEYGHYQVFTVKERYHDNLNGFLQSRIENGHYLSKKMLFNFASQLLEALQHLHSKQYIHAPGEINALHVYFNQMYDELFLDIGRSPSFITAHWITQNSQSIAMNPFVSPEFKEYVVSFCHSNNSEMTYQYSEKDDVYSFGILLFMMTTLLLEPEIISGSLMVQKTKMLQEHIAEQIDALNSTANSLSDIISIIAKAVDPNPANRATLKELAAILKTNPPTVQVLQPLQKFEEEYIIIKKVIGRETAKKNGNGNTTEKVSTFLVEQRKTFNRFYATRVVFQDYLSALQYRNSKWKEAVDLQHKNIVPIYNVFLQNNNSEQYQVIVVKERCQESLIEFIEFRKESNENLDEDLVLGFASQLLSALQLLHSKHYCYSPGELNPSHIYLNETRDEILLDVGSSSPSITSEYLLQHAQELSLNPFVSPECKQFIASLLQEKSKSMNYVISEKDDVYNVGVLVYMMITLNSDTKFISDSLIVPSSQTFEKFMMEHIESMNANYSPKLSGLLIKTLNPNARKRFGIDSLSKLLLTRSVVGKSLSPTDEKLGSKFEDRYTIVNTINTLALNNSQELEKNKRNSMQLLSVDNNICTNYRDALSLFEVEHKETLKKYIALCASFRNEKDAIQYYDSFKQKYILKHDNLIPIVKMCIQKSNMYQFQVYILKEVYRNNFVDCIDNRRKNNAYFTEDTIIDYSSQLLSLVDYLHFNEYIHAPGEICSKNLYFSETHNDLLLDIGKNSNIPVDWIMHNSQSLLQNPFLAPEYKPFFISRSRWSRRSQTLKCTKKADVYCVGVLIYMLITLTSDLSTIYNALEVPKGMTFDNHIKSLVESVPVSIKYSEKLVHLLQMALRPTPTSRLEASELRKML